MSAAHLARMRKRQQQVPDVAISPWQDPSTSVHPARRGGAQPTMMVSPMSLAQLAQPATPTYKVRYPPRPPEPTDDEDEDEEDAAENADVKAPVESPEATPAADEVVASSPATEEPAVETTIVDESPTDTPAKEDELDSTKDEAQIESGVAPSPSDPPAAVVDVPPSAPSPLPTDDNSTNAEQVIDVVVASPETTAKTDDEVPVIVDIEAEPAVEILTVEVIEEAEPISSDAPPSPDKKVMFAPGTPEPRPTTRKKKSGKSSKSKSKKKGPLPVDEPESDVVVVADQTASSPPDKPNLIEVEEKDVATVEIPAPETDAISTPVDDDIVAQPSEAAADIAGEVLPEDVVTVVDVSTGDPSDIIIIEEEPESKPGKKKKKKSKSASKSKIDPEGGHEEISASDDKVAMDGLRIDMDPPPPPAADIVVEEASSHQTLVVPGEFPVDNADDGLTDERDESALVADEQIDSQPADSSTNGQSVDEKEEQEPPVIVEETVHTSEATEVSPIAEELASIEEPVSATEAGVEENAEPNEAPSEKDELVEASTLPTDASIATKEEDKTEDEIPAVETPLEETSELESDIKAPVRIDSGISVPVDVKNDLSSTGEDPQIGSSEITEDTEGGVSGDVDLSAENSPETETHAEDVAPPAQISEDGASAEAEVVEVQATDAIDVQEISAELPEASKEEAELQMDEAVIPPAETLDDLPSEDHIEVKEAPIIVEVAPDPPQDALDANEPEAASEEPPQVSAPEIISSNEEEITRDIEEVVPETTPQEEITEIVEPANNAEIIDETPAPVEAPPSPALSKGSARRHRSDHRADHWERPAKKHTESKVLERPKSSKGETSRAKDELHSKERRRKSKRSYTTPEEDEEQRLRREARKAREIARIVEEERIKAEEEELRRIRHEARRAARKAAAEKMRELAEAEAEAIAHEEAAAALRRKLRTKGDFIREPRVSVRSTRTKESSKDAPVPARSDSIREATSPKDETQVDGSAPASSNGSRSHRRHHRHRADGDGERHGRRDENEHGERRRSIDKSGSPTKKKKGFLSSLLRGF